jgi:hypothetical protein
MQLKGVNRFFGVLKKSLYYFFNFENEPLIRCRVFHFPSGSGENKWEKFHVLEFDA